VENSIKVSQPYSLFAPKILRILHGNFSTTSRARRTVPRHQIMETEYMLSVFPLKEESEEVPKKFGNGICRAVVTLTNAFLIQNFKIFILTCEEKKISLLMNFIFRMTVMFCSRFTIPDLYFSFRCHN
jgi:hypothetical protein